MARELSHSDQVMCSVSAEDDVLSDVDTYADWLYGRCMKATIVHCRIGYVPRDPAHLLNYLAALDIPQLVSLSLYPSVETAGAAMWELRQRYLADPSTKAYIRRLAAEKEASL